MAKQVNAKAYAKNALKSAKYISVETIKGISPNLVGYVSENAELVKDMYHGVKDFKNNTKNKINNLLGESGLDEIKSIKKNVLSDLRTGKFYNPERENENAEKMMSAMGMSFDFDDLDFDVDESDVNDDDKKESISTIADKISFSQQKSSMTSAEHITRGASKNMKLTIAHTEKMFGTVNNSLAAINSSILAMHNDLAMPLNNHIINSMNFYQSTTSELAKQTSYLENINNMLKERFTPIVSNIKANKSSPWEDIMSSGLPDLRKWGAYAKNKALDTTGLSALLGFLSPEFVQMILNSGMLSSPISAAAIALLKNKAEKGAFGKSLRRTEELAQSIGLKAVTGIHAYNKKARGNGFLGALASILDIAPNEGGERIDVSKYNKGRADWTGKDAKALRDVIPVQLSKIISILSGKPAEIFDYESGKWRNAIEIRKDFSDTRIKNFGKSDGFRGEILNEFINEDKIRNEGKNIPSYTMNSRSVISLGKDYDMLVTLLATKGESVSAYTKASDLINTCRRYGWTVSQNSNPPLLNPTNLRTIARIIFKKRGNITRLEGAMYSGRLSDKKFMNNASNETYANIINGSNIDDAHNAGNLLTNAMDEHNHNVFYYLSNILNELRKGIHSKETNQDHNEYYNKNKRTGSAKSRRKAERKAIIARYEARESNRATPYDITDPDFDWIVPNGEARTTDEDPLGRQVLNKYGEYENPKPVNNVFATSRATKEKEEKRSPLTRLVDKLNTGLEDILYGDVGKTIKEKYKDAGGFMGVIKSIPTAISNLGETIAEKAKGLFEKITSTDFWKEMVGNIKTSVVKHAEDTFKYGKEKVNGIVNWFKSTPDQIIDNDNSPTASGSGLLIKSNKIFGGKSNNIPGKWTKLGQKDKDSILNLASQGFTDEEIAKKLKRDPKQISQITSNNAFKQKVEALKDKAKETVNSAKDKAKEAADSSVGQKVKDALEHGADAIDAGIKHLFGDADKYNNAKDTANKAIDAVKSNLPKTIASGAIGAAIGAAATGSGLGLLGGFVIGAGSEIIKNSDSLSRKLFGEKDEKGEYKGGKLSPKISNFIMGKLPKTGKATALGGILGTLGLAPGGIFGGMVIGAGLELVSGTETFKDILFGKEDINKKRKGGILGSIKYHVVDPLINFTKGGLSKVGDFFKNEVFKPITGILNSGKDWIKGKAKKLMNSITDHAKDIVKRTLGEKFNKIFGKVTGAAKKVGKFGLNVAKNVISKPFQAIDRSFKKHNIKRGYSSMTPEERVAYAKSIGKEKIISGYTKWASAEGRTGEEIEDASNYLNGTSAIRKNRANIRQNLADTITASLENGGMGDPKTVSEIKKMFNKKDVRKNDDYSSIIDKVNELTASGKIGASESEKLLNRINEDVTSIKSTREKEQDFDAKKDEFFKKNGLDKLSKRELKNARIQAGIDAENFSKKKKEESDKNIADARQSDSDKKNAEELLKTQEKENPIDEKRNTLLTSIKDIVAGIAEKLKVPVKKNNITNQDQDKENNNSPETISDKINDIIEEADNNSAVNDDNTEDDDNSGYYDYDKAVSNLVRDLTRTRNKRYKLIKRSNREQTTNETDNTADDSNVGGASGILPSISGTISSFLNKITSYLEKIANNTKDNSSIQNTIAKKIEKVVPNSSKNNSFEKKPEAEKGATRTEFVDGRPVQYTYDGNEWDVKTTDASTKEAVEEGKTKSKFYEMFVNGGLLSSIKGLFSFGKKDSGSSESGEKTSIWSTIASFASNLFNGEDSIFSKILNALGGSGGLTSILSSILPSVLSGAGIIAGTYALSKVGESSAGTGKDSGMSKNTDAEARKEEVSNYSTLKKAGLGIDAIENTIRGRDTTTYDEDDYVTEYETSRIKKRLAKNALYSFNSTLGKSSAKVASALTGKKGLVSGIAQVAANPVGTVKTAATKVATAGKAVASKASSVGKAIASSKVGQAVASKASSVGKAVASSKVGKAATSIVSKIKDKLVVVFNWVLSKFGLKNADTVAKEAAEQAGEEIAKKGGSKLSASVLSKAAVVLNIATVANAALEGFQNAKAKVILGILDDPTTGQKFLSAALNAANEAIPFIGGIIPTETLFSIFYTILKAVGIDFGNLEEQRAEAKATVEAFNKENGTTYNIEEYVHNVLGEYTIQEKIVKGTKEIASKAWEGTKNVASKVGSAISSTASKAWEGTKNVASKVGSAISSTASKAWEGTKNVASNVWNGAKSIISNAGEKIGKGVDYIKDANSAISTMKDKMYKVFKDTNTKFSDVLAVKAETSEDNPLSGIVKTIGDITKITYVPQLFIRGIGEKLYNSVIKPAVTSIKKTAVSSGKTISSALKAALHGDFNELYSNEADIDETNPIGGIVKGVNVGAKMVLTVPTALSWVGHKIGDAFVNLKDKAISAGKNIGTTVKNTFGNIVKGDVVGLWQMDSDAEDEDNPTKIVSTISDFGAKVFATVPTGLVWLGKKVGDAVVNLKDKAISAGKNIGATVKNTFGYISTGDISGLWKMDSDAEDEDNPMKLVSTISDFGAKVYATIPTGMVWIGKKVGEAFNTVKEGAKTAISNVGTSLKTANEYRKAGDLAGLWKMDSDANVENNPMGFISMLSDVASKVGFSIPTIASSIGHKAVDLFKNVKDSIPNVSKLVSDLWKYSDPDSKMSDFDNTLEQYKANDNGPFGKFGSGIVSAIGGIMRVITTVVRPFRAVAEKIGNFASKIKDGISTLWDSAGNWVNDTLTNFKSWLASGSNLPSTTFDDQSQNNDIHTTQKGNYSKFGNTNIDQSGCGPAVASTVLKAYGKNVGINSAAKYAEKNNYVAGATNSESGTKASYFSDILGSNGIKTKYTENASNMASSIKSGKPTILLGQDKSNKSKANSPFGPNPHYVVARGTDGNGNIVVDDPELNNTTTYDKNILKHTKLGIATGGYSGIDDIVSTAFSRIFNSIYENSSSNSALQTILSSIFGISSDSDEEETTEDTESATESTDNTSTATTTTTTSSTTNNTASSLNGIFPTVKSLNDIPDEYKNLYRSKKYTKNTKYKGISPCIVGNNTVPEYNVLRNCVGWACARFNHIYNVLTGYSGMKYPNFCCNAKDFITVANKYKLTVSKTPQVGAIMCWSSSTYGHVAVVEEVISNTEVVTSESGWNASVDMKTKTRKKQHGNWEQKSGYTFQGFIYNPGVQEYLKNKATTEFKENNLKTVLNGTGSGIYDFKFDSDITRNTGIPKSLYSVGGDSKILNSVNKISSTNFAKTDTDALNEQKENFNKNIEPIDLTTHNSSYNKKSSANNSNSKSNNVGGASSVSSSDLSKSINLTKITTYLETIANNTKYNSAIPEIVDVLNSSIEILTNMNKSSTNGSNQSTNASIETDDYQNKIENDITLMKSRLQAIAQTL